MKKRSNELQSAVKGQQKQILEKLFHEHEVKTNRRVAIGLLVVGVFYVAVVIIASTGIFNLVSKAINHSLMLAGNYCVFVSALSLYLKCEPGFIRPMLTLSYIVPCAVAVMAPFTVGFAFYAPIFIAGMYYKDRAIKIMGPVMAVLYSAVMAVNVICEPEEVSPFFHKLHEAQTMTIWRYPQDIVIYYFIPNVIFIALAMIICLGISKRGREIVLRQAAFFEESSVMKSELNSAADIQVKSLPEEDMTGERYEIHALMRPAKEVGGDFYDYFEMGDNIVFMVADVSDKGLAAAMFMMRAKNAIRLAMKEAGDVGRAVNIANRELCSENPVNMFVTLWIGAVNVRTGEGKYVSCGHPAPALKGAEGARVFPVGEPNPPLGLFEEAEMKAYPLQLKDGETLTLYTDGVTDALNEAGDSFGADNFLTAAGKAGANIATAVLSAVDRFCGNAEQFDDITVLSVSIKEPEAPERREMTLAVDRNTSTEVIDAVNETLKNKDCPEDVRRNLDVVLDEVLANIEDYAYPEGSGEVSVSVCITENSAEFEITDRGVAFNPLCAEEPDLSGSLTVGGLGIYLTKNLVDSMEYERRGEENVLRLKKIWKI